MNDTQQQHELMKLFERRHPDGRYYYSDKDVRHFLPMMAFSSNVDIAKHPNLRKLIEELLQSLSVPPGASQQVIGQAIHAYYKKHPVHPELLQEYRAFCRRQTKAA